MAAEHGIAKGNRAQRTGSAGRRSRQSQNIRTQRYRPQGYGPQRYGPQSDRARYERLKQRRQRMRRRRAAALFMKVLLTVGIAFSAFLYFQNKTNDHSASSPKDILGLFDSSLDVESGEGQAVSNSRLSSGGISHTVGQEYIDMCGMDQVDKPQTRTLKQVIERLNDLAADNDMIAQILQDSSSYPQKMLEALANNPEMADFVLGYLDSDGQVTGGLTKEEIKQDFPLFLQWDPRWGYAEYGDESNIGLAGCGPTCLSMALYYLTKDESLTPDYIAAYSMKNGYYISGTGTAWALMQDVPAKCGIGVSQPKAEEYTMKDALDRGRVIICSMGPGDFTAAGHFIVIYGYDADGFLVNDPNCVARSRQSWSFSELKGQIKNVWVLGGKSENKFSIVTEFSTVTDYSIY